MVESVQNLSTAQNSASATSQSEMQMDAAPFDKADNHRIVIALLATFVATTVGGATGWFLGGLGNKKNSKLSSYVVGGALGVASGIIALDANLRAPAGTVSLAKEAREKKNREANTEAQPPIQQVQADTILHGGFMQPTAGLSRHFS